MGVAILLFALTAGLLWWGLAQQPGREAPASGDYRVYVVGPASLLHEGTVSLDEATAWSALMALAAQRAFAVEADDLPGCGQDYVRAVAGHGESADGGGWNYYFRDGASWQWQGQAASCAGIVGDEVLWCWVDANERCAVYPD